MSYNWRSYSKEVRFLKKEYLEKSLDIVPHVSKRVRRLENISRLVLTLSRCLQSSSWSDCTTKTEHQKSGGYKRP
jgi:hypothetical protein